MSFFSRAAFGALLLAGASSAQSQTDWQPLLDAERSKWQIYLGYPNADTPVAGLPKDEQGNYTQPVGYDRNERQVFNVSMVDDEPVLRISGEIYGGIFTREDYGNYHLRLQVKWGEQKWEPRAQLPFDSGILYHGKGEHGVDYWRAWPLSQEFQIVEQGVDGTTGDWWKIAHSQIDIRCEQPETEEPNESEPPYQYNPKAPIKTLGGNGDINTCRASANHEKPVGEWNTLDLITYGDKSLHIVNGEMVMALSNSSYPEEGEIKPLTRGQIVLQSEAGETFYRRIEIRPIEGIPEEYQDYFE